MLSGNEEIEIGRTNDEQGGNLVFFHCGTPFFLPPEIVAGSVYTNALDMWSVECIAYNLLAGSTPFGYAKSYVDLCRRISLADFTFPSGCAASPQARDFVNSLLTPNSTVRLTALQALSSPCILSARGQQSVPAIKFNYGRRLSGVVVEFANGELVAAGTTSTAAVDWYDG